MKKYKTFDHTADIGIEITGKTRKELFSNALKAMLDIMVNWPRGNETSQLQKKTLRIKGNDLEDTLINFLREALYLFNGESWLIITCEPLELTNKSITARLQGEPYNRQRNSLKTEIKAVTYHSLSINKSNNGWQAKVVLDV